MSLKKLKAALEAAKTHVGKYEFADCSAELEKALKEVNSLEKTLINAEKILLTIKGKLDTLEYAFAQQAKQLAHPNTTKTNATRLLNEALAEITTLETLIKQYNDKRDGYSLPFEFEMELSAPAPKEPNASSAATAPIQKEGKAVQPASVETHVETTATPPSTPPSTPPELSQALAATFNLSSSFLPYDTRNSGLKRSGLHSTPQQRKRRQSLLVDAFNTEAKVFIKITDPIAAINCIRVIQILKITDLKNLSENVEKIEAITYEYPCVICEELTEFMERANSHSSQHIVVDEDTLLDQLSDLIAIYKTALDRKTINDLLHTERLLSSSEPRSTPISTPIMYGSRPQTVFHPSYKQLSAETSMLAKRTTLTSEQEIHLQDLLKQWQGILNLSPVSTPKKAKRNFAKEARQATVIATSFVPQRSIFLDTFEDDEINEECKNALTDASDATNISNEDPSKENLEEKLNELASKIEKFFEAIASQLEQPSSSHTTSAGATAANLPQNWFN